MSKEPCEKCGAMILPETKRKTGGLCVPCIRKENPAWSMAYSADAGTPPTTEIPSTVHPDILAIVQSELALGNEVSSVGNWPHAGRANVCLKYKFKGLYQGMSPDVGYAEDHDPHGPFAQYFHKNAGDAVLCSIFA